MVNRNRIQFHSNVSFNLHFNQPTAQLILAVEGRHGMEGTFMCGERIELMFVVTALFRYTHNNNNNYSTMNANLHLRTCRTACGHNAAEQLQVHVGCSQIVVVAIAVAGIRCSPSPQTDIVATVQQQPPSPVKCHSKFAFECGKIHTCAYNVRTTKCMLQINFCKGQVHLGFSIIVNGDARCLAYYQPIMASPIDKY